MILYILLIAHFLADFTLQTDTVASRKRTDIRYLHLHGGIYACVMVLACGLFLDRELAGGVCLTLALSHYLIDMVRFRFSRLSHSLPGFLMDQALHIGIILQMVHLLGPESGCSPLLNSLMEQYPLERIARYALLFLVITDPASVFVKLLTATVSPRPADPEDTSVNVGKLIGILERLVIAFLVLEGALSSIGFVMTAKSLARYKELNDKKFAENYLVGTLSSTAIAIAVTLLLKG